MRHVWSNYIEITRKKERAQRDENGDEFINFVVLSVNDRELGCDCMCGGQG